MKTYEIWSEEIVFNGNRVPVTFHGRIEADSFEEACEIKASRDREFKRYYNLRDNKWYGARLYPSQIEAIREDIGKAIKDTIVSYEEMVNELVYNPQLIISALFKLIFKDEDDIPEEAIGAMFYARENELLKSRLTVSNEESKVLREQIKKEKEGRKKLSDVLRRYSNDELTEDEAYKRSYQLEQEHKLEYYESENQRLKKALEEYERVFKKLGIEL